MRTPGDDEQLNNTNLSAAEEAAEQERLVNVRVAQAKAEEEVRTQTSQVASQKRGPKAEPALGAVVVGVARKSDIGNYGPELPYPHGTQLVRDKKSGHIRPTEGSEEATHVCARIMGTKGWEVQRAIPLEVARAQSQVAAT